MRPFKPGDKVWVTSLGTGGIPAGTYAGLLLRVATELGAGWWDVDLDGFTMPPGTNTVSAHEKHIRHRDDPPPQQEPKKAREPLGSWEKCGWKPRLEEVV